MMIGERVMNGLVFLDRLVVNCCWGLGMGCVGIAGKCNLDESM